MIVRTILVCANGAGSLASRLTLALQVARLSGGLIQVLAFRSAKLPQPSGLLPFGQDLVPEAESSAWDREAAFLDHARATYNQVLGSFDVAADAPALSDGVMQAEWIDVDEPVDSAFSSYARASDLIVTGGYPGDTEISILDDDISRIALLESGRLVLFAGEPVQDAADLLARVVIAWDDGPAAARAIAQAAPLIAAAAAVRLVVVETDASRTTPCNQILAYLRRLTSDSNVRAVGSVLHTVGHTLLAEAEAWNASLIIMGAYEHARGREIVLGGTTRFVIGRSTCPVLAAK